MTDSMPPFDESSREPSETLDSRIRAAVRDVPDFPTPGILFKDITPVLADPVLLRHVVAAMARPYAAKDITHVVGIESRGFLFGTPIALLLGAAFVPVRKPGKLPWQVERESYALEYREDVIEIHRDAFASPAGGTPRVLIVDDVLATGGTAAAACRLVERLGAQVVAVSVLMELTFLNGRSAVSHPVRALTAY
ncbi:MAG: adenine phosphoribosyltransferase [Gemmatimonadaceae bacterium]|nr:adenine phosphoribosyltransferase [Gemmatimonadaceae bacterium]